jgi:hypothetical protein
MKYLKIAAASFLLLTFTGCFQITHFLDLKDNGALDVQWSFRFSKALDEMKKDESGGISSEMEKGTKDLPQSFGGLVRDLKMDKFTNEFDSGVRLSFTVPDFAKVDYSKLKEEEFPILPRFDARKKELIFHFSPLKKDGENEAKKEEKPEKRETPPPPGDGEDPSMPDSEQANNNSADDMGKKLGQMFLSSVRYQIILGKNLRAGSVVVKKGAEEIKVEAQALGEHTLIDLPLFALLGEKEQPFDLIVRLK